MRTLLSAGILLLVSSPVFASQESVCLGKPARIMDAASAALAEQLSGSALKVPEIGRCDVIEPGSVLGFDHSGSTLYLVQANCLRKAGVKMHVHAVMECDAAKNRFAVLGLSWGGAKAHGVAGGVAMAR